MADYGTINPLLMANALRGIAPHGFRHVESVQDVSVPKGSGWYGYLPNQEGSVSTEISARRHSTIFCHHRLRSTQMEVAHTRFSSLCDDFRHVDILADLGFVDVSPIIFRI